MRRSPEQPTPPAPPAAADSQHLPQWPTREQFGDALSRILDRKARILLVYTRGLFDDGYNYRDQFRHAFPGQSASPQLNYEYFPSSDRTFATEEARRALIAALRRWLNQTFLAGGPSTQGCESDSPRPARS